MGKSSGPSGPQQVQQTTTNLPAYAEPFYRNLLERATFESERPLETYPGQRLADFDPYEQQAMSGIADMAYAGDPIQMQQASELAAAVGYQDPNQAMQIANAYRPSAQYSGYFAGDIDSGYDAGALDNQFRADQAGQGYQAGQRGVGYDPIQFDQFYDPRNRQSGYDPIEYQSGFDARTFDPGYFAEQLGQDYTAKELQSQFDAGSVATDPDVLAQYMSPYAQLVTDIERREAIEAGEKAKTDIGLQAAGAGGLGGYREAIMLSEADKNIQQQLADIQATGGQRAYEQALAAYEADRGARVQEEQLRQQAFVTSEEARRAQQQLAVDTFRAGEDAKQQAARLGMSAQEQEDASRRAEEQFAQSAFEMTDRGRQQAEQFDQRAFEFSEQARQQAAQMGMTVQQQQDAANRALEQFQQDTFAQNEQLRQAQDQLGLSRFQANEQARLAQQQEDRAVFQASESARQQAASLGLNAQEIQERVNQAENAARMEARALNNQYMLNQANLAMGALGEDRAARDQILSASQQLGNLGGQDQRMDFERLRNLQAAGQNYRGLDQRSLDMGYEDFLRQQAFGQEQLAFFSNILQGLPVQPGSTQASFGPRPSTAQQLLGAGIGGVGLYNALT